MAPPNRFAALHDGPPPSSPEFSIRKPFQDEEPAAKRRRGARVVKTYSDRPRRQPILPPDMQQLRRVESCVKQELPSSSPIRSSIAPSCGLAAASDRTLPSPPRSLPSPTIKLRRSPRSHLGSDRVPLAPIFLSFNARPSVKREVKEETDWESDGSTDGGEENRIMKKETTVKPEPLAWTADHRLSNTKQESVIEDLDREFTPAVKREDFVKPETRVKREWPIFSFAARTNQQRRIETEPKDEPIHGEEEDEDKSFFKAEPEAMRQTPKKDEGHVKMEDGHPLSPPLSSPRVRPTGARVKHEISVKHEVSLKREINAKQEPSRLGFDRCMKQDPVRPLRSAVKDEVSNESDFESPAPNSLRIKTEPPLKTEPRASVFSSVTRSESFFRREPKDEPDLKEEDLAKVERDVLGDTAAEFSIAVSSGLPAIIKSERRIKDQSPTPSSTDDELVKREERGSGPGPSYNMSYKDYVNASRQQAAVMPPPKRVKKERKVQTTLNLSSKLPFKECKVCDTVYNPLHPADVKLHQEMHGRAVRGDTMQDWSQCRKRRREF